MTLSRLKRALAELENSIPPFLINYPTSNCKLLQVVKSVKPRRSLPEDADVYIDLCRPYDIKYRNPTHISPPPSHARRNKVKFPLATVPARNDVLSQGGNGSYIEPESAIDVSIMENPSSKSGTRLPTWYEGLIANGIDLHLVPLPSTPSLSHVTPYEGPSRSTNSAPRSQHSSTPSTDKSLLASPCDSYLNSGPFEATRFADADHAASVVRIQEPRLLDAHADEPVPLRTTEDAGYNGVAAAPVKELLAVDLSPSSESLAQEELPHRPEDRQQITHIQPREIPTGNFPAIEAPLSDNTCYVEYNGHANLEVAHLPQRQSVLTSHPLQPVPAESPSISALPSVAPDSALPTAAPISVLPAAPVLSQPHLPTCIAPALLMNVVHTPEPLQDKALMSSNAFVPCMGPNPDPIDVDISMAIMSGNDFEMDDYLWQFASTLSVNDESGAPTDTFGVGDPALSIPTAPFDMTLSDMVAFEEVPEPMAAEGTFVPAVVPPALTSPEIELLNEIMADAQAFFTPAISQGIAAMDTTVTKSFPPPADNTPSPSVFPSVSAFAPEIATSEQIMETAIVPQPALHDAALPSLPHDFVFPSLAHYVAPSSLAHGVVFPYDIAPPSLVGKSPSGDAAGGNHLVVGSEKERETTSELDLATEAAAIADELESWYLGPTDETSKLFQAAGLLEEAERHENDQQHEIITQANLKTPGGLGERRVGEEQEHDQLQEAITQTDMGNLGNLGALQLLDQFWEVLPPLSGETAAQLADAFALLFADANRSKELQDTSDELVSPIPPQSSL